MKRKSITMQTYNKIMANIISKSKKQPAETLIDLLKEASKYKIKDKCETKN